MGTFYIKKTPSGAFNFVLLASNKEKIAVSSQVYTTKSACKKGIESVGKNAVRCIEENRIEDLRACDQIKILAESEEAGFLLGMADDGRKIFVQGHPEYDRLTLDKEYRRDLSQNKPIELPVNYYPDGDPTREPLLTWRSNSANLYENWLNYYVYQVTPYDI